MATFHIFPSFDSITGTGSFVEEANGRWDINSGVAGESGTIVVPFSEGVMYLDNDPTPLELNDLPSGFTITAAQLKIGSQVSGGGGYLPVEGTLDLTQNEFGNEDPTSVTVDSFARYSFDIEAPYSEIGYIGLNQVTARMTAPGGGSSWLLRFQVGTEAMIPSILDGSSPLDGFFVTGTYEITNFRWLLTPTTETISGEEFTHWEVEEFDLDSTAAPIPEGDEILLDEEPDYNWYYFPIPFDEDEPEIWVYEPRSPGTGWILSAVPSNYGWWDSMQEAFLGNAAIVHDATPKRPRGFEQIALFATGTASPFGGHPGPGTTLRQKLVYAGGSYTVGTDYPLVRIFDGLSDRELVRIPPTLSGAIPKAIMSMMTFDGVIYLTTFDSGTTSADFAGRVFSLDMAAAKLELIGATFSTGEIPYCLAWHNGRLWCGTNQQDPAASGAIYWFRPGVDTVWTQDKVLSTEGMGGALCMASYGGKLYVGCSAPAGTPAEILARSPDGSWATSHTGTGLDANNGFIAMSVYPTIQPSLSGDPQLFASYWNQSGDTELDTSIIVKYNGSAWETTYTGAGELLLPFIALANINLGLYAVGGGYDLPAKLVYTNFEFGADFTSASWHDLTAFLPDNELETATNIIVDLRQ